MNTRSANGIPGSAERLAFLHSPGALACLDGDTTVLHTIETHMSWVFLAERHVLKLKKPVHYPYLDFSTLSAREMSCREELRLNARLAPGVYLGLLALTWNGSTLSLVREAAVPANVRPIDWLVLMRRLPRERMLDALLAERTVQRADVDALGDVLIDFYRRLPALTVSGEAYVAQFEREHAINREVLLRPQFDLPGAARALDRFAAALQAQAALVRRRAQQGRIVDGHGDLRPEHVCLLPRPVIIDALEFNAGLRRIDPFDEIAFLGLECEMAGAQWIGPYLARRCCAVLEPALPAAVLPLYTAYRALLRARLAAAHLLEQPVRDPMRWLPQAQRYVDAGLRWLDAGDALGKSVSAATTRGTA